MDNNDSASNVFLSHNSRDKPAVRELVEALRERGLTVWLDMDELRPGMPWQPLLEGGTGMAFEHIESDEAAEVIAGWIDEFAAGLPPLVLIDEAERMLAHLPHRFFERLHGMLGRVCLVLATRKDIADIPRDDKLNSPLLNRLELQRFGLLEAEGVDGLIRLGANLLLPSDAALTREWAGRHPFFLSLLGHYLWDARRHAGIAADTLEEFQENAYPRLSELWQTLSEQERRSLWNLNHGDAVADVPFERRGLTDHARAFGKVLTAWLATQH